MLFLRRESKRTGMKYTGQFALVVGAVLASLILLELGCRVVRGGTAALAHWPNFARGSMGNGGEGDVPCAYPHDDVTGWGLSPRCATATFNVDRDGFRVTRPDELLAGPPVLATGSSFMVGEEVADDETMPAHLQRILARRVINAGVSGFALDQTVLRSEQVVRRVRPLLLMASFTPGDIRRAELKVAWSRNKPWFAVVDGELALRDVPVPASPGGVPLPTAARLLGWSALAEFAVQRLGVQRGWYFDEVRALPPGTGQTVSCLMMARLARLDVPVVVVAQYGRAFWTVDDARRATEARSTQAVLDCATRAGLLAFDTAPDLQPVVRARGVDALYRADHHSAEGNRVVAGLVMAELLRRKLLPQSANH